MLSIILLLKFLLLFQPDGGNEPRSIYDFKVSGLLGDTIDFADFKGKKILIVNTASKCGYTPQYEALERLYKENKEKLVIIGFPANNFGSQEPGTNAEIASFCQRNYGVTFPMAEKISVRGDDMAPIYHWLTEKDNNQVDDSEVEWNFQKYLIDEKGHLVAVFPSALKPDSKKMLKAINGE
jgi:glutathione peroxidase